MVSTARTWSAAQISAAVMFLDLYVVATAALSAGSVDGARQGEYRGVRFLRWDHGPVEVLEDVTPDAAMTALLEEYNAAEAEHFPD